MTSRTKPRRILARLLWLMLITSAVACSAESPVSSNHGSQTTERGSNPPAIEFPTGLDWLNVAMPLTLADLRGKIVILDFWTYGCINCLHVADELKIIEERYPEHVVVISVHTPKFENEKNLRTLRDNVIRYDLRHPVVNDTDYQIARTYGMRAWPTLIVVDPAGKVLGRLEGEDNIDILDRVIRENLEKHAALLDIRPIALALEKEAMPSRPLSGPSKIAVSDSYVAISDSLNHRVLITDHQGKLLHTFPGPEGKGFRNPQGLAFGDGGLYVADTGNHLLRFISLPDGKVETLAGTGSNRTLLRSGSFDPQAVNLRSPWGLALRQPWLYIAMAGSHQVWRYHTKDGTIEVYAGSSREGIDDGDLASSTFSQPSGLAFIGESLFVADTEDSAVREIDLVTEKVMTLVGKGLFDFGDVDGSFDKAELQHLAGIASDGRFLYIADSYNHKIKRLDLDKRVVVTLLGTGKPGSRIDGEATEMNEPGGLAIFGEGLLIADTNNHRLLYYSPENGGSEWRLSIE